MADPISDVLPVIKAHAANFVDGNVQELLRDFQTGRAAQLLGSVSVPPDGVKAFELRSLTETDPGVVTAEVRYTASDKSTFVLRSRWREVDGAWRVFQVRNLPETPPRFGTEGPSADGLDEPYWAGLRKGELRLQRCTACRRWMWGPSPICARCHTFEPGWEAVEPVGTIFSWTRTWQPFAPEAAGHLPYVVVLAELPRAGHRRILGVLLDAGDTVPAIGCDVRGEFEPAGSAEGWPLLRWRLV